MPLAVSAGTVEADHGRIETRTAIDIDWLTESHAWPGLSAVSKVVRLRRGGRQANAGDGLLPAEHGDDPERLGEVVRSH
jgi:hypothetical protein